MERKVFLCKNIILVMILLGQLHGYKSCIQKERMALLELKNHLISQSMEFALDSVHPTWTNDTTSNCCQWEQVKCNRTSRRIIELSIGTPYMYLIDGSLLNLSLLHPFEELRSLDLSECRFSGLFDDLKGYKSLKSLRNLEILDLSLNEFSNNIFPFLKATTSLTTLFLRGNNMNSSFPFKEFKDLTNLELLDLSKNRFNGSISMRELSPLIKLRALDLSGNEFSGSIELQEICEMKNMQELDLSKNKLVGQFPLCLTSLNGLRVLDLSSNQLTGKLPSSLKNLESIEYLSLFDNNFEGRFSLGWLANLTKLKVFKLYSKSSSLQLELESSWKPKFQLRVIVLRSCNLEKVPHFLLNQKDLRQVDLSDNKLSGHVPSWLVANNTKLEVLLLQNNSFTSFQLPKSAHHSLLFLDVSVNDFNHLFPENTGCIFPHLRYMNLAKNNFQGNMPSSFGNLKDIEYLDISHNNFHGMLPRSFVTGCYSLKMLKLSHNKLSGEIFSESVNFTDALVLSMDNNQFTRGIGQGLRSFSSLYMLDISNNNLTGVIPRWIGELSSLDVLLISNNLVEGEIPLSLFNKSNLLLLDLSGNNLSGRLPPQVNSLYMVALFLQDNNLSGVIPKTLLVNVTILDVRNNRLSGNIPEFINTLNISILLLRGNKLTGHIPHQLCSLRNIHILDLANNGLNGFIPSCLSNISFGVRKEDALYFYNYEVGYIPSDVFTNTDPEQDSSTKDNIGIYFKSLLVLDPFGMDYLAGARSKIEFVTKHRYDAYMDGHLISLSRLDLSENELAGRIPIEIGSILGLHALNLSHNYLSGGIPETFSGMKNVESLDLSYNRLQGQIPPQLTELSSLAIFNVSYNNLSGVIPQGRQFNTFDMRSYLGNPLLCGKPTNRSCDNNNFQKPDSKLGDESIDMVSFYWSFVVVYVTILLGILASLSFDSRWRRAWFYTVDAFIHKVRDVLW